MSDLNPAAPGDLAPGPRELTEAEAGRLRDIAADIRRTLADPDPASPFATRPDAREAAELQLRAGLLRAGVDPAPPDPETEAQRQHAAFWGASLNDGLAALCDARVAALTEQGGEAVARAIAEAREAVGAAEHARLVALAKAAVKPGETLPKAAEGDLFTLRALAAYGTYREAAERARPPGSRAKR